MCYNIDNKVWCGKIDTMKDLLKQESVVTPESKAPQKVSRGGGVVLAANLVRESVSIDRDGNIISSKNPREARIIGKPLFVDDK